MRELLGVFIAVTLAGSALLQAMPLIQQWQTRPVLVTMAAQLTSFGTAVEHYTANNFTALLTATASGPVVLTPAFLTSVSAIDPAFVDQTPWQQTHAAILKRVTDGSGAPLNELQAWVTTCGGTALSDPSLAVVAENTTPDGAMIRTNAASSIVGATGQKLMPTSAFSQSTCALTPGHYGRLIFFDTSYAAPSYLERFVLPGAGPEPNTLHADTSVGTNQLTDIGGASYINQATTPPHNGPRQDMINNMYATHSIGDACTPATDRLATSTTSQALTCVATTSTWLPVGWVVWW